MKQKKHTRILPLIVFLFLVIHSIGQEWTQPVKISTMDGYNEDPSFCIDSNGTLHVAWSHKVGTNYRKIYYSQSTDEGETWSTPQDVLQNDTLWMGDPQLGVNSENKIFMSYDYDEGNYFVRILLRTYDGQNWSQPDTVSGGIPGYSNRIVIDNNDRVYVFWFCYPYKNMYYRYFENNTWSDIICPYDNDDLHFIEKAIVDNANNLHCTGVHHYSGQSGYDDRVIYFKYTHNTGQWSDIKRLSDNTSWQGLDIDLDVNNLPRISWRQYLNFASRTDVGTFYSFYNGTSWSTPELIAEGGSYQTIAIDSYNRTHICDTEQVDGEAQLIHYQQNGDVWEELVIDYSAGWDAKLFHFNDKLFILYCKIEEEEVNIYLSKYNIPESTPNSTINYNTSVELKQNYPNPFSDETTIKYNLNTSGYTKLEIINLQGNLVKTLVNEHKPRGQYTVYWEGKGKNGKEVKSGLYIIRLHSGKNVQACKVLLTQ